MSKIPDPPNPNWTPGSRNGAPTAGATDDAEPETPSGRAQPQRELPPDPWLDAPEPGKPVKEGLPVESVESGRRAEASPPAPPSVYGAGPEPGGGGHPNGTTPSSESAATGADIPDPWSPKTTTPPAQMPNVTPPGAAQTGGWSIPRLAPQQQAPMPNVAPQQSGAAYEIPRLPDQHAARRDDRPLPPVPAPWDHGSTPPADQLPAEPGPAPEPASAEAPAPDEPAHTTDAPASDAPAPDSPAPDAPAPQAPAPDAPAPETWAPQTLVGETPAASAARQQHHAESAGQSESLGQSESAGQTGIPGQPDHPAYPGYPAPARSQGHESQPGYQGRAAQQGQQPSQAPWGGQPHAPGGSPTQHDQHYGPAMPNAPQTGAFAVPQNPGGAPMPSHVEGQAAPPSIMPLDLSQAALVRQRKEEPRSGWRRALYKASFGGINPGISQEQAERNALLDRVRTPIHGCHKIAVVSLKGGIGKTTTTSCLGLTLAHYRGDRVVALDANPDAGTLAERLTGVTDVSVRTMLDNMDDINSFTDISRYMSLAGRLQVLASDQDAEISEAFNAEQYTQVTDLLARYYNVVLTDSGTGMLHSAMKGTLEEANSLVVVGAPSVDGSSRASKTLDWLVAHGYGDLVARSVAVISSVRAKSDSVDMDVLRGHFSARCRAVVEIPYDPHLVIGGRIDITQLKTETERAYIQLAAAVADGFQPAGG